MDWTRLFHKVTPLFEKILNFCTKKVSNILWEANVMSLKLLALLPCHPFPLTALWSGGQLVSFELNYRSVVYCCAIRHPAYT